jgi:hypothetical protein
MIKSSIDDGHNWDMTRSNCGAIGHMRKKRRGSNKKYPGGKLWNSQLAKRINIKS